MVRFTAEDGRLERFAPAGGAYSYPSQALNAWVRKLLAMADEPEVVHRG